MIDLSEWEELIHTLQKYFGMKAQSPVILISFEKRGIFERKAFQKGFGTKKGPFSYQIALFSKCTE